MTGSEGAHVTIVNVHKVTWSTLTWRPRDSGKHGRLMNSGGWAIISDPASTPKKLSPRDHAATHNQLWWQLLISQRFSAKEERWTINLRMRGMTLVCVARHALHGGEREALFSGPVTWLAGGGLPSPGKCQLAKLRKCRAWMDSHKYLLISSTISFYKKLPYYVKAFVRESKAIVKWKI